MGSTREKAQKAEKPRPARRHQAPRVPSQRKRHQDCMAAARTRAVDSVVRKLESNTIWGMIEEDQQAVIKAQAQEEVRQIFLDNKEKHLSGAKVAAEVASKALQQFYVPAGTNQNKGQGLTMEEEEDDDGDDDGDEEEEEVVVDESLPFEKVEYIVATMEEMIDVATSLRGEASVRTGELNRLNRAVGALEAAKDMFSEL
ncbi:hypothetical protein F4779DRAFT_453182 [Xylariaceae sp. FL0662B]|nr:hypothetical protein F4779DRAFT_453182 [Xylariaceae sp. FL0662B]